MRKEELKTYIENHESEMIEDLKSLIRIPSEKQAAEPGKPFGAPAAEALAQGIEILEKYGYLIRPLWGDFRSKLLHFTKI